MDTDLLTLLFSYLEAKQDLNSVCLAIDLYVNNRIYKRAIELFDKYCKQIASSEYDYLTSMIEIAKEMNDGYSSLEDSRVANKSYNIFNSMDLKNVKNFQYVFTIPFKDLCKSSKRCTRLLDTVNDLDYINIIKLPEIECFTSNVKAPLNNLSNSYANLSQNLGHFTDSLTPFNFSKHLPVSSLKKHISTTSTPQSVIVNKLTTKILPTPITKQPQESNICISQPHSRTLTSSLKISKNVTNSVTKSVKFQLKKYTREISNENKEYNEYEDDIQNLTDENNIEKNQAIERKILFFEEEIDDTVKFKKSTSDFYESNQIEKLDEQRNSPKDCLNQSKSM